MRIETYQHRTGTHCASTALRNLLGWAGLDLSEPMVFGLGAGLDFYYGSGDPSPSRRVFGRSSTLEADAADALGLELEAIEAPSAEVGWSVIVDCIEDERPLLVRCDAAKLPYREDGMPFDARCVVVIGVDSEGGRICLSDGSVGAPQWVDRELFVGAWWSENPSELFEAGTAWRLQPGKARPLEEAIRRALRTNQQAMAGSDDEGRGLQAASQFRDEIDQWRELDDAAACFHAAYRAMEHPETGGGNFRNLYRDFLNEAVEVDPELGRLQVGLSMGRTADAWSTLGTYLAAMKTYVETSGEEPAEDPSHHVESMAEAAYQFEATFWNRIASLDG
jgi:hypothetical protein